MFQKTKLKILSEKKQSDKIYQDFYNPLNFKV
jgi:hypothetical protein